VENWIFLITCFGPYVFGLVFPRFAFGKRLRYNFVNMPILPNHWKPPRIIKIIGIIALLLAFALALALDCYRASKREKQMPKFERFPNQSYLRLLTRYFPSDITLIVTNALKRTPAQVPVTSIT